MSTNPDQERLFRSTFPRDRFPLTNRIMDNTPLTVATALIGFGVTGFGTDVLMQHISPDLYANGIAHGAIDLAGFAAGAVLGFRGPVLGAAAIDVAVRPLRKRSK